MEKRPPCGLSLYIHATVQVSRALYVYCRSPQPNGRSVAAGEQEAEREHPYIEHWRSRAPYDETAENSAELWLNSSVSAPAGEA